MTRVRSYMLPQVYHPYMGLGDLIGQRRSRVLPKEVGNAAADVIPGFFIEGKVAPKYREHLLENYRKRDGNPPRRDDNGHLRSVDETRLDRAWNDIAEDMDRSEGDIRSCVLNVYESAGEYENKPARLRNDFNEILNRTDTDTE